MKITDETRQAMKRAALVAYLEWQDNRDQWDKVIDAVFDAAPASAAEPIASVSKMVTSAGVDFYVMLKAGDREISMFKFAYENRAQYTAEELNWLFGRSEKPNLADDRFADPKPITNDTQ